MTKSLPIVAAAVSGLLLLSACGSHDAAPADNKTAVMSDSGAMAGNDVGAMTAGNDAMAENAMGVNDNGASSMGDSGSMASNSH